VCCVHGNADCSKLTLAKPLTTPAATTITCKKESTGHMLMQPVNNILLHAEIRTHQDDATAQHLCSKGCSYD
jgi:hypothetical protein